MSYENIIKTIKTNQEALKVIREQVQKAYVELKSTGAMFSLGGRVRYVPDGKEQAFKKAMSKCKKLKTAENRIESKIYNVQSKFLNNLVVVPGDIKQAETILGKKVKIFSLPYADKGLTIDRVLTIDYNNRAHIAKTDVILQGAGEKKTTYTNRSDSRLENTLYLLENKIVGILVHSVNHPTKCSTNELNGTVPQTYYGLPIAIDK